MTTTDPAAPTRTPGSAGPARLAVLVAAVVLVAVSLDIFATGPLTHLDHRLGRQLQSWDLRSTDWPRYLLTVGIWFGQRGVVLTMAVLIAGVLSWRHRTLEPVVRLVVAVLALLAVVYAFKLGLGRNAPIQDARGEPAGSGSSYPSGHVANAVLLWGLADWSLLRWPVSDRLSRAVHVGRWIAPFAITVAMTLLNYHWLSDFIGGAAVGVLLLALVLRPVWAAAAAPFDGRRRRSNAVVR
ncbi:MAG: phosphatase PAP2 family protein [bacterium]